MRNYIDSAYRAIGRFAPAAALSAALLVGLGTIPALAHTGAHDPNQSATDGTARRAAFEGYRAGYDQGVEDRDAGEDFDYQHDENYLQASAGSSRGVGSTSQYQNAFRQAYARGYTDGYNGRGRDGGFDTTPVGHDDDNDGHDSGGSGTGTDMVRLAARNGFRSGFEHGVADRRERVRFNYQHDEEYRRATAGFPGNGGRWGLQQYQTAFRQAYARGYSQGFSGRGQGTWNGDGHGGYDSDGGYGTGEISQSDVLRLALVKGYNDGFEHGLEDRSQRAGFDYQHDDSYRQATSGYDRRWNMLGEYQRTFRQGYARGYADAFNGRTRNRSYDAGVDRRSANEY